MSKVEAVEVIAIPLGLLRNVMFKVTVDENKHYGSPQFGGERKSFRCILPGGKVLMRLSPYDLNWDRITYRNK